MLIRQPIRNNTTLGEKKPRVFDALIDTADGEIYLELKNAKQREVVRLCDVLAQIEQAKRKAGKK
jgi:succinate dehydrogenase flavin-adding protein (antitoxin of CptAB toxin-antitoxin module)